MALRDLDQWIADLRAHRDQLRQELVRVDAALHALKSGAPANPSTPPSAQDASLAPQHKVDTATGGAESPAPRPVGSAPEPEGDSSKRVESLRRRVANLKPGTALYTVLQFFKEEPDHVFNAEELNERLAALGIGQDADDPVNSVRGALSRLERGGALVRVRRGHFKLLRDDLAHQPDVNDSVSDESSDSAVADRVELRREQPV